MDKVVYLLLSLSLAGGALTVLAMGLNALLYGRVPHCFRYYLWLLVLARYFLPVGGGEGLLGRTMSQLPVQGGDVVQAFSSEADAVLVITGTMEAGARSNVWAWPVLAVWLTGVLLVLGYSLAGYYRLCRQLEREAVPARPKEQELLHRLGGDHPRKPKLMRSGAASSPVLIGVFRPKIYLPLDPAPDCTLEGVLRHELTHWRRKDLLYKWMVWVVTSLHWFNPAVWLLRRAVERDCELSCDETVTQVLPKTLRLTYGRALLWAAEREAGAGTLSAPFYSQKQCLIERLNTIMRPIPRTKTARSLLTGAAVVLVITSAALGVYAGQKPAKPGSEGHALSGELVASTLTVPETLAWPFQSDGEIALTGLFGTRVHPITGTTAGHDGIDVRLERDQPVLAAADGVVTEAAFDSANGQYVVLEHGGGLTTVYCNLSDNSLATVGEQVMAGEQIGTAGNTGTSTGCHLHFEVMRDGVPVDPLDLLPYRGGETENGGSL